MGTQKKNFNFLKHLGIIELKKEKYVLAFRNEMIGYIYIYIYNIYMC